MSNHELSLLAMGGGVGIYLAFVVALLATVVDDFRRLRRERAATAQTKD